MQADDAIEGQTSLKLKCYKILYHTIPRQRSWQFLLFFFSHWIRRGKKKYLFPSHSPDHEWHTPPDPRTPSPFHSPCWTPLKLYPNIPIIQGTFPHQSLCNTKSPVFSLMGGGMGGGFAKLFLIHSFWERASETSRLTNWPPCRRLHDQLSLDSK